MQETFQHISVLIITFLEEILSSTHALDFSADGRYLAYVNFNATSVPYYKFPRYGSQDESYTTIEKIAYPKVTILVKYRLF